MIFRYPIQEKISVIDYLNSFHLAKSKIYTLFSDKLLQVNGVICNRQTLLNPGDTLELLENEEIDFVCDNKKLDILYEDDYFLIINKPSNILVHPDDKNKNGTVCNIVANYYRNKGYDLSVKYAHRLDMDTTGILIFCKDMLSMAYMNHMISLHEVKRYYLALVGGRLKDKQGILDYPIGEDRHHNSRRRVSKTGKTAVTEYKVLSEYKDFSLVEVLLQTGRTHQIRVHFSHIGHPLLGDVLYNGSCEKIKRTALHSYKLKFLHPVQNQEIELEKGLPYDLKNLCDKGGK